MESSDPRVRDLEKLAEKQMKSVLNARFLEQCKEENVIPKGLRLKLKINVGGDEINRELQASVDSLLVKVSGEIRDRIRDYQQKRAITVGEKMESIRGQLKQSLSSDKLFDVDETIHRRIEDKKDILLSNHQKKLSYLKIQSTCGQKSNQADCNDMTQSNPHPKTQRNGTNQTNKPNAKRRTKSQKNAGTSSKTIQSLGEMQTSNQTETQQKSKQTSPLPTGTNQRSDVLTSKPTENKQNSKNDKTPGPPKTYAEALKNGVSLQETVRNLVKAVTEVAALVDKQVHAGKSQDSGGSSESKTRKHGGKPKKDYRRYGKENKPY